MPVKFVVHERFDPRDLEAPKKYYAMAKSSGELSFRRLSNRISSISSASAGDVAGVLTSLEQVINEEVAEGNIIRFGDFGSFFLTFSSIGSSRPEEVTAANIHSPILRFKPGPGVHSSLKILKYERLPLRLPPLF
jgi:predicted histone-like DNA-binding protein